MSEQTSVDVSKYVFYALGPASDIPVGERIFIELDDQPIVILNVSGKFYAIGDVCTHDEGPLGDGDLEGFHIVCPRHGAEFDVRNGKAMLMPAVVDIPAYPVKVKDGAIFIGVPRE